MTRHTPGPWRAVPDCNYDTWEVEPVTESDGFDGGFRWFKEADAHLIAAAPDLFDACKALIKFCSRRDGSLAIYSDWIQCFVEDGSTLTEVVERAVAAIKKAEGVE